MKYTIKDIAKKCSVSIFSVSKVLNNKPVSLKAEKRARILRIAGKYNYAPNSIAQSLKTGKSGICGLVISHLDDRYTISIINLLDRELGTLGKNLIISNSRYSFAREIEIFHNFKRRFCDLIYIMTSFNGNKDDMYVSFYNTIKNDPSVVFIDSVIHDKKLNYIASRNHEDAARAVEIFIKEKKISNVAYLSSGLTLPVLTARKNGVAEVCCRFKLPCLCHEIPDTESSLQDTVFSRLFWKNYCRPGTLIFFESYGIFFEQLLYAFSPGGLKSGMDFFLCGFDKPVINDFKRFNGLKHNLPCLPFSYIEQNIEAMINQLISHTAALAGKKKPDNIQSLIGSRFIDFPGLSK
ncbi:MAG TPA: hypothetical protein DC049_11690 [Spirochaetia bacterium]|nr:hypothetical protein [Spirochaetia bacterium]